MKNSPIHIFFFIAIVLIGLSSCETESSRSLSLNTAFLSLKPTSEYTKKFANADGDTVDLYLSESLSSEEDFNQSGNFGSIGDIGQTTAERRNYIINCDNPQFNFNYRFFLVGNAADERGYSDILSYSLNDSIGTLNDELSFIYRNDSVFLNSNPAFYQDSLTLISKTFTEVFGPHITDPNENRMFYIKLNRGLVGFRTHEGITYELIN